MRLLTGWLKDLLLASSKTKFMLAIFSQCYLSYYRSNNKKILLDSEDR
jgi:hypothetical protein